MKIKNETDNVQIELSMIEKQLGELSARRRELKQILAVRRQLNLSHGSWPAWRDRVMFGVLVVAKLSAPELTSLATGPFEENLGQRQLSPLPVKVGNFASNRVVEFPPNGCSCVVCL